MNESERKDLDDLLDGGNTLMVTTRDSVGGLASRPLTVAKVKGSTVQILFDRTAEWARELEGAFPVHVTLSDNRDNKWVSMNGTASISADRALIDELWSPFAGAFFEQGKESPGVSVMSIDVTDGEFWSTPSGRLGSLFTMLKAKFGDAEKIGERGEIDTAD